MRRRKAALRKETQHGGSTWPDRAGGLEVGWIVPNPGTHYPPRASGLRRVASCASQRPGRLYASVNVGRGPFRGEALRHQARGREG